MKKIQYFILAIIGTAFLYACGSENDVFKNTRLATGARVKFIHASPGSPGVEIRVNDLKFSGVATVAPATPNVMNYGAVFPAVEYATIPAGSPNVKIVVPATATTPEAVAVSANLPTEDNKAYSVFAAGSAPNLVPVVLADVLPPVSTTKFFVRFVNLTPNSTSADVGFNSNPLFSNVPFRGGNATFTELDAPLTAGSGVFNTAFAVRVSGAVGTTPLIGNLSIINVRPGAVITIYSRGAFGSTTTPVSVTFYSSR